MIWPLDVVALLYHTISMTMRTGGYRLKCSMVGVVILGLCLLAFAHQMPTRTGPVVFGPDGSLAVLCLASDETDGSVQVGQHCEACRIAQAMDCARPNDADVAVSWSLVERDVPTSVLLVYAPRTFGAAPRAPPV